MSRISDDELFMMQWRADRNDFGCSRDLRELLDAYRDARAEIARLTEENARLEALVLPRAEGYLQRLNAAEDRATRAETRLTAATTVTEVDVEIAHKALDDALFHMGEDKEAEAMHAALTAFVASKQAGAGEGEAAGRSSYCCDACWNECEGGRRAWHSPEYPCPHARAILTNPLVVAARKGGGL